MTEPDGAVSTPAGDREKYADDGDSPAEVFGWVSGEAVSELIAAHGGVKSEVMP